MTPSGLAIGQQGKRLYVVCSDANVAAVVDISEERSHVEGFIPTGWYPTAARELPNGTLVVLNGRGNGSHPVSYTHLTRLLPTSPVRVTTPSTELTAI